MHASALRDHVLLYVNGRRAAVHGHDVFQPLSTFLRQNLALVGTKVVCAEGDCGACTVLIGRPGSTGKIDYQAVNACIQYVYQLDGASIITVEAIKDDKGLHPVQDALVAAHSSQCGYCTPGFVMSLAAMCEKGNCRPSEQNVRDAVTGNLCRCTGYLSIIQAGCAVDPGKYQRIADRYHSAPMLADLTAAAQEQATVTAGPRVWCKPVTVGQAVACRSRYPGATLLAGATDLGVRMNKGFIDPAVIITLSGISSLAAVSIENNVLTAGAAATWSQIEDLLRDRVPQFHRILTLFGSPQIRAAGTIGGNIANASPIADSLPFLYVTGAELEITGPAGTRVLPIDRFYKGYKQLDLASDELITAVRIPLPSPQQTLKLYKVSRRRHLDISSFTAAFLLAIRNETFESVHIAYGGVGPTVVRLPRTEAFLTGKKFTELLMTQAADIALAEISPISDVRGAASYRNQLAANILSKLYFDCVDSDCTDATQMTEV